MSQLLPDLDPPTESKTQALAHLSSTLEEPLSSEDLFGLSQKAISLKVDIKSQECLLSSLDNVRDKARLSSLGIKHAGDWLNVVPCPTLGLQLRPTEFRTASLYRLGMPVFRSDGSLVACGQNSDK